MAETYFIAYTHDKTIWATAETREEALKQGTLYLTDYNDHREVGDPERTDELKVIQASTVVMALVDFLGGDFANWIEAGQDWTIDNGRAVSVSH